MTKAFPVTLLLLGALFVMSACGALPRPFAHGPGEASGLRPVWADPVSVVALPQVSAALGPQAASALRQGVADRLADSEIPAVVADQPATGYAMVGTVRLLEPPGPGLTQFVTEWQAMGPEGQPLGTGEAVAVVFDGDLDDDGDGAIRSAGSKAAEGLIAPLEAHMAGFAISGTPGGTGNAARAAAPAVRVTAVTGLPEDRGRFLADALRSALKRAGVAVAESADAATASVSGAITVAPPDTEGLSEIAVIWTVRAPDGVELGTVEQRNAVPARMVENGFAALAAGISAGGAEGVAGILAGTATGR